MEEQVEGQSQVNDAQIEADRPGSEDPQAPAIIEGVQPGKEPGIEGKVFTEGDVLAREAKILSAKDREIAAYQQRESGQQLQQQIYQMQAAEAQAQATDRGEVDQGIITPAGAQTRQQGRMRQVQQQTQMAAQMATSRQVRDETEQYGRVLVAREFGERYGVNPEELVKDTSLVSPSAMEAKAAGLALERTKSELKKAQQQPQHFDQGQSGAFQGNASTIIRQYGEGLPGVSRQDYENAMKARNLRP